MTNEDLATKKDLADGLAVLEKATKKDLADGLAALEKATKKDLADGLAALEKATKKDLADGLTALEKATKKDLTDGLTALEDKLLKELATQKGLAKTNDHLDRLTAVVLQNSENIKSMQATLEKVVYNQDLYMAALTNYAGDIKDYRLEKAATDATLSQQNNQLQDHERRIRTLEEKVA